MGKYVGLSFRRKGGEKSFFLCFYFIDCDIEMLFFYSAAALKVAGALAFA